jgi:ACR3 family arsenite efflux pump ArsB
MEARTSVTLPAVARLAAVLYRLRFVSVLVALAAGSWFVLGVLNSGSSTQSLLALSLLLWAGLALGIGFSLVRLPPRPEAADRWATRLRKRVLEALYWFATIAFLILIGFSGLLSLRALRLAFG